MIQQQIHTDEEALKRILQDLQASRLLLVRGGRSFESSGAASYMRDCLTSLGCTATEFADFKTNPKHEEALRGAAVAASGQWDALLAVGGGSVIDMAKLIRYYAQLNVPLIAIPTTAGSGAESTPFAVCYKEGIKHSISDESLLPDHAILLPRLTYHNNPYLTACSGFDALAQAIEAYWNVNETEASDRLALQAIPLIIDSLQAVVTQADADTIYRDKLMKGANLSGQAISITRTTLPHALSYTFTTCFGYPHGHAVALTFPFFLNLYMTGKEERFRGRNFSHFQEKMLHLRQLLGLTPTDSPLLWMKNYLRTIGLGFDAGREFDNEAVVNGINLERAKNSPFVIDHDTLLRAVETIR